VLCPKCRAEVPDAVPECPRCGVVFARYLERVEPLPLSVPNVKSGPRTVVTMPPAIDPNLAFHEAGHWLFFPFGPFMTTLGGSLNQVLVPLVCAGAFLWKMGDAFGAAAATWWAAENLIDLAPYIDDAGDLQLVLLGGKTGSEVFGHDWEYLMNAMGVAHEDHALAAVVQTVGTLTMIAALFWPPSSW
jgi:hypothetical protein